MDQERFTPKIEHPVFLVVHTPELKTVTFVKLMYVEAMKSSLMKELAAHVLFH